MITGQPGGARAQPAARPRRVPVRAIALLAAATAAAALAAAALVGEGSAPTPASLTIVPLRVSSGHGIATGFAVPRGRVVTVAHVLDGPVTVDGRRARVLRVDRRSDLALLSAPEGGVGPRARPSAAHIAGAADGEQLWVVRLRDGRPSTLPIHARRSIVAHVRAAGAAHAVARPALELAASARHGRIASGDSGAAVITNAGELAGIVFAASRNRADTAYAVDASELRRLLGTESLRVGHPAPG